MMPRIGIYFHARKSSGGIYQYSLTLLKALASVRAELSCDVVVFYSSPDFPRDEFESTGWQFVFAGHRVAEKIEASIPESVLQYGRFVVSILEQLWTGFGQPKTNAKLKRIFRRNRIDLMIYPSPRRESFESGTPFVMVVHDIQHRLQPHFPEVSRFGEWKRREYVFKHSIQKASVIVAESELGKEHVVKFYDASNARIEVLPYVPAIESQAPVGEADVTRIRQKYGLPDEFIFYPAQFWSHKNHYRLVQAIKLIYEQKGIRIPTVFVGSAQRSWGEFQKVMKLVQDGSLKGLVHYLNYVPARDMPLFYRAAKFLVMPTFFGPTNIPVLEAFQLGCPVITSDIPGIREQVGDAALLIDPDSAEDIAKKVLELWSDEHSREKLVKNGFRRSNSWTMGDFAERLRQIIHNALVSERPVSSRFTSPVGHRPMSVLVVHNSYQEPGGEDVVVEQELAMLRDAGHRVLEYRRSNAEVGEFSDLRRIALAKRTVWSSDSKHDLKALIARERPEIVHVHNTFLVISPSVYYACAEADVPVIRTLQNYRLLCPAATFFRSGTICEKCLGKTPPWPGVAFSCYRDSRTQTGVVAALLTVHRLMKTWQKQVDMYIAVTNFMREKYIEGGFSSEKIVVKPNTIYSDPGIREEANDYVLFAGRLASEKGVCTLISAWRELSEIPIRILGDGLLMAKVRAYAQASPSMEVLGWQPHAKVFAVLKGARFLVVPSEWYEGFPMTIVESFACGVPVIASRIGSIQEIVKDGETGLMFAPGNAVELRQKVEWAWTHKEEMQRMGHEARREYEKKYSPVQNYKMLMEIYERVIENHRRKRT